MENNKAIFQTIEELLTLDPSHEVANRSKRILDELSSSEFGDIHIPETNLFDVSVGNTIKAKRLNDQGETLLNFRGDVDGAYDCFTRAMKYDPGLVDSYVNLGVVMEIRRNFIKAIELYDEAIRIAPNFHMPWFNKGNCYRETGELDKALECFKKATDLNPDFFNSWLNKGVVLMMSGKYKKAYKSFNRALELNPGDPRAQWGIDHCEQYL